MCFIEWCNNNQSFTDVILTLGLVYIAVQQWRTSEKQRKTELFSLRFSHYQKLQELIGQFQKLIPYNVINGKLNIENIVVTDKNIETLNNIYLELDYLTNESKYLFANKRIYNFEAEFLDKLRKIKCFYKKGEVTSLADNICNNIQWIADNITERKQYFDKDLNLNIYR